MENPCHRDRIANLKRIEGQIRGIIAMIEDKRYCIDILDQLKAVKNSISSVEHNILGKHMSACVRESLIDSEKSDEKIDELIKLLKR